MVHSLSQRDQPAKDIVVVEEGRWWWSVGEGLRGVHGLGHGQLGHVCGIFGSFSFSET